MESIKLQDMRDWTLLARAIDYGSMESFDSGSSVETVFLGCISMDHSCEEDRERGWDVKHGQETKRRNLAYIKHSL